MWSRYIAGEYGGMNEVMARLSRLTRDRQFLECARLFDNVNFFFGDADHTHGLAANVDTIRGKHANQHIPQITGALETFRSTGELPYYQIADNFWDIATNCYMYTIGGVAGARTPEQRRVLHRRARLALGERLRQRRAERDLLPPTIC